MRALHLERDRLEGNGPEAERVGQRLKDDLFGNFGRMGQGDAMPAAAQDLTVVRPGNFSRRIKLIRTQANLRFKRSTLWVTTIEDYFYKDTVWFTVLKIGLWVKFWVKET